MNPKQREWIRESLVEFGRRSSFVRIYPAPGSDIYDRFFQIPRLSNRVLYRFLYEPTI
jgi:hypothetical protein